TGFNIIRSNGKKLRLLHLLNDTISKRSGYINKGEYVGLTAPKGQYNSPNCNQSSDDYHVHLSLETEFKNECVYKIDGYTFECSGMQPCKRDRDDKYNLTFEVNCNRKYLNQKFNSTNGFPLDEKQCYNLVKNAKNSLDSFDSAEILKTQVCLRKKGLYDELYTREADEYTKTQTLAFLESITEPTTVENNPLTKTEVSESVIPENNNLNLLLYTIIGTLAFSGILLFLIFLKKKKMM
ncbi:MAG: hypothetical protein ACRCXZ_09015, partial [Patescibacteria group bacterium]